jgi:murein DD-endopeptidase MepM/ murein hydrolase activator NlpD
VKQQAVAGGLETGRKRRPWKRIGWLVLLALVAIGGLITFRTGATPTVSIQPRVQALGRSTSVQFTAREPARGLVRVQAELVQGDSATPLREETYTPRPAWDFWGPRQSEATFVMEVGSDTVPTLKSGSATLRLRAWAAETWARHPAPTVQEITLPVRLAPPSIQVLSSQNYVAQGGAGVVVYRVGETAVRDGVRVGDHWFRGRPLAGPDKQRRYVLYGVPYDLSDAAEIRLVAEDDVGNRGESGFVDRFFRQAPHTDTIHLNDRFLAKAVPEIMGQTPGLTDQGSLLANYLEINGALRHRNAQHLVKLSRSSPGGFYWTKSFLQLPDSKVMSTFADRRTYLYAGKVVDHQTHLGFDLASVERAPVPAANRGKVVLARYFGIYGNAVVIDHGAGLMSLYGHLSSIAVHEGQMVERGQLIGHSGATGLAGGDHLHFTTLVGGVAVTPVEWWDDHWIEDRVRRQLVGAWPALN